MLYQLQQALLGMTVNGQHFTAEQVNQIVQIWSAMTEGFPPDLGTMLILGLLNYFQFYGFVNRPPFGFLSQWGGRPIPFTQIWAAMSSGDLAANSAGWQFWQQFMSKPWGFEFDICKYINNDWLEAYVPKPIPPKK